MLLQLLQLVAKGSRLDTSVCTEKGDFFKNIFIIIYKKTYKMNSSKETSRYEDRTTVCLVQYFKTTNKEKNIKFLFSFYTESGIQQSVDTSFFGWKIHIIRSCL